MPMGAQLDLRVTSPLTENEHLHNLVFPKPPEGPGLPWRAFISTIGSFHSNLKTICPGFDPEINLGFR